MEYRRILQSEGSQYLVCLHPQFQSQEAATRVFIEATTLDGNMNRHDAVQHFRATLHSCWQEGRSCSVEFDMIPVVVGAAKHSGDKRAARRMKTERVALPCYGPTSGLVDGADSATFMQCSACHKGAFVTCWSGEEALLRSHCCPCLL